MSKITKWLLKNISSQKAKDFTCLIREGENIIKRIAEEAGNASYEITKDDGKVLTVALYYTGGVSVGRCAYFGSERNPEYRALRNAAECIPGVTFEKKEKLIFKSPDGDDSWMEPWEKDPAPGQEEATYRAAEQRWNRIQKEKAEAKAAAVQTETQTAQSEPEQASVPKETDSEQTAEPEPEDPNAKYKALGIDFDEEGYPIIYTAEQFNAYEGTEIPWENLRMSEQELRNLVHSNQKAKACLASGLHTKKYLKQQEEAAARNEEQKQKAVEEEAKRQKFWNDMKAMDERNRQKAVTPEEKERREKEELEKKVQETRTQKQAQGIPVGGMPELPEQLKDKYGGTPTASGFTQAQIDTIKEFQKKTHCENNPELFNKYINSWNPKFHSKRDLTPENATEFCQWCEMMGEFMG